MSARQPGQPGRCRPPVGRPDAGYTSQSHRRARSGVAPGPLDPRAALSFCGARTLLQGARQGSYLLRQLTAGTFARQIDELYSRYDWQVNYTQLNLLDSHDTARALWLMGDDQSALGLCVLLQMTMPGAPCIYDGDEIGLRAAQAPLPRRFSLAGPRSMGPRLAGVLPPGHCAAVSHSRLAHGGLSAPACRGWDRCFRPDAAVTVRSGARQHADEGDRIRRGRGRSRAIGDEVRRRLEPWTVCGHAAAAARSDHSGSGYDRAGQHRGRGCVLTVAMMASMGTVAMGVPRRGW